MRKAGLFFIFLFFLLFLTVATQTAKAIDKSSDDYYQELVQKYRNYQQLIDPFENQRSRYLTYKSVETQADFLSAAKTFVTAEVEAITAYTVFIKTYLAEATQVLNYQDTYLYVMLDDELSYLSLARKKADGLSSLSETQTFLDDLSSHYQKISQIGYQVKSGVEIASANKILSNLQIETTKIGDLLDKINASNDKVYAAKEKFSSLKEQLPTIQNSLNKSESLLKNPSANTNFKSLSQRIRTSIDQAVVSFETIILGYQNIIESLE